MSDPNFQTNNGTGESKDIRPKSHQPSGTHNPQIRKELHEHIKGRGLISSVVLGLCDGLVTNVAFLAGFGETESLMSVIRFAGLAVMIAGGVSMFFGGLLAGQSQHDLYKADAARELLEIEKEPEEETEELRALYLQKGLTKDETEIVVERITSDKQKWLEDLLTQELHIHRSDLENPLRVAAATGVAFLAGSSVPLVPYMLLSTRAEAILTSIVVSLIFLFGAGYWKGQLLRQRRMKNALQTLAIGAAAAGILYAIGSLIHMFV